MSTTNGTLERWNSWNAPLSLRNKRLPSLEECMYDLGFLAGAPKRRNDVPTFQPFQRGRKVPTPAPPPVGGGMTPAAHARRPVRGGSRLMYAPGSIQITHHTT